MGTRRSIGWLPSRAAGYLFVIAAATAVIVFVVTGAALVAAADPIVIDYSHDLVIGGAPANHYVWDVGKVEARSQWRFSSSEPVPYEIGIRSAFDPDESNAKPHASYQWEDLNKYAFRADDFFSGETTVAVPVRSGLVLERRVQPDVLAPGHNKVSISAGIFVSAEAAIDGKTVDRNGGELWLKADGSGGPFEEGGLIGHNIDGLAPLEIVSVVGDPYLDLDTRFANGDVKNIWVDADIFNPNDIPVRYFPGFEAKIHVDSSPLGYVAPAGETFDTSFIGIETWSYGERALFVLDSLDGAERDWRYEYSTRGLWHVFDEAIVAAPGEVALNEILILPLDPGPTENSFSEAKPEFDATLASVGGPDPDEFEVPDGGNGGVTIKVDSAQGFLGFANPNLVGTTDLRSASEGPASTVNSTSGDTGVGATSPERSLAGASANAIEPNRDVPDVTDPKLTPDDPEPDAQRGFFVNPAPGNSVDLPLADLADPAVLSVIGILVTLFGATVQLAREQ